MDYLFAYRQQRVQNGAFGQVISNTLRFGRALAWAQSEIAGLPVGERRHGTDDADDLQRQLIEIMGINHFRVRGTGCIEWAIRLMRSIYPTLVTEPHDRLRLADSVAQRFPNTADTVRNLT